MKEEYEIIDSPLSRTITQDGVTIDIHIYRGENDPGWILEVVDETAGSTVWSEPFPTDKDALNEVLRTIKNEGIRCFLEKPVDMTH